MENPETKSSKADRNFYARERTSQLQHELSKLLQHSFFSAQQFLELTATHRPDKLTDVYPFVLEPYLKTMAVIRLLEEGKRSIVRGLDSKWYGLEHPDLFSSLSPETQEKLRLAVKAIREARETPR